MRIGTNGGWQPRCRSPDDAGGFDVVVYLSCIFILKLRGKLLAARYVSDYLSMRHGEDP